MIIHDLNAPRRPIAPLETNTPAIINADAVTTLAISHQLFQPVARRYTQIIETVRKFKHIKLTPRYPLNVERQLGRTLAPEYPGRLSIFEIADHSYQYITGSAKRQGV